MLFDGCVTCNVLRGRGVGCGGCVVLLTTCLLVQLGVGFTSQQQGTPVAVSGLSSGVAMVALGQVRLFSTAAQLMLV